MSNNTDKANNKRKSSNETSGNIIKRYPGREYAIIPNTTLEDIRIKDSLALLCYLVGKPENWTVRFADLTRRFGWKKHKIYRLLKELELAGYLRRTFLRDSGGHVIGVLHHIANEAIFDYEPLPNHYNNKNNQSPSSFLPHADYQQAGNQDALIINKSTTKKELFNNTDSDPSREIASKSELENCIIKEKVAEKVQQQKTPQNDAVAPEPLKQHAHPEKTTPRASGDALSAVAVERNAIKVPYKKIPPELIHCGAIQEVLEFVGVTAYQARQWVSEFGDALYVMFSELKEYSKTIDVNNVGGWFNKRTQREREVRKLIATKV